ncbi:MAG: Hsp70 family protein [Rhizobiales bacterium]|nr:Hsp70 family protein [Hyphomicrobiales bacterium]
MNDNKSAVLGIDFGTSNSAVAIMREGKIDYIQLEDGKDTLPTAIFFDFKDHQMLFGSEAATSLLEGVEGRYMRALKSVLGTALMREKRMFLGQRLDFYDIISAFLVRLKQAAEVKYCHEFKHVLAGKPVYFHSDDAVKDKQALEDLTECYKRAGFTHIKFMDEPVAAAYANVSTQQNRLGLIVDIGGGTSDFCLFKSADDTHKINIIASHGVRIGGTNIDKSLSLEYFMPLLGKDSRIKKFMSDGTIIAPKSIYHDLATWEKIPFSYTHDLKHTVKDLKRQAIEPKLFVRLLNILEEKLGHELAFIAEDAKIRVNEPNPNMDIIDLGLVESGLAINTASIDLNAVTTELYDAIEAGVVETLNKANLCVNDIDDVIFVGGTSNLSTVSLAVQNIIKNAKFRKENLFTAIVDGLAIAGQNAFDEG